MYIDTGKQTRTATIVEEKNNLMTAMFILLLSEKSIFLPNVVGGYSIQFLEHSSRTTIEGIQDLNRALQLHKKNTKKQCLQIVADKAYEIYLSKNSEAN